jgi:integrase
MTSGSSSFYAWMAIPRRQGALSGNYVSIAKSVFRRFSEFLAARFPTIQEMGDVSHEMAVGFLASERGRGISGRSFNAILSLLKTTFRHLRRQAGMLENPFEDIVSQAEDTIHRIPYSPQELQMLARAAQNDPFCRPLIVTGMCTAMRRGDVCQLRWTDVDMKSGFITVNTSKTGAQVCIPMFGLLRDELVKWPQTGEFFREVTGRIHTDGLHFAGGGQPATQPGGGQSGDAHSPQILHGSDSSALL